MKYAYRNEINDKVIGIKVHDITAADRETVAIDMEADSVKFGDNFKELDFTEKKVLRDKHMYLLSLLNSRGEIWYVKFQYRKK